MMTIQTFVFFDLETTGIPADRAKITEITLISVSRTDIEQADGVNLPATNKLSILCNPRKSIQPAAVKLTGLTNQFLENQPDFKDNIKCINAFLDKPKPVCLLAHNGNRFDFKILQAEYRTANEELPRDLLCVDTINAFRTILKNPKCSKKALHDNSTNSLDSTDGVIKEEEWQDLSTEEIQQIDEFIDRFSLLTSTPKRMKAEKESKIKTPKEEIAPKFSYSLCSLYEKLLNKKVKECHRAEADCIMLLECAIATKHDFLDYADSKPKLISDIK